jgi:hypothetical protein
MNQRDRQWATVIIWVAFAILLLLAFDRGLMVTADFEGLWPQPPSYIYPQAQDAQQLQQIIEDARAASPEIMARVQESIRAELALRVPFVIGLSILLIMAATACTWFVWRNAGLEAYLARMVVQGEKAKRRSRIEQFVDDLAPEEMEQLRARLADDGAAEGRHVNG